MCRHSGTAGGFLLLLARDDMYYPIRDPFSTHAQCVAGVSVLIRLRALQCDKCQLWSHTKCVGIVDSVYGELQVADTFPDSVHPVCLQNFLPLRCLIVSDVEFLGTSVDEDILPLTVEVLEEPFHGLRVLYHNVQGLHSKMDELS